jgi:3-oxoacyl-[acyl-carrier protein] reductase
MLNGCNVVITGATGGLGRALSQAFWNAGANLLLTGRSPEKLREVRALLPSRPGGKFRLMQCDLAHPDGFARLIVRAGQWFGQIDVLVNNAGMLGPAGPAWENDWREWTETMYLNLLVPVQLCRGMIPMMRSGGSIINISGGGATSPRPNFSAYAASKAALVRFSETLAVEAATLGIRVNCIAPGIMRTRMVEQIVEIGAERSGVDEFCKAQEVLEKGGTPPETPSELTVMLASQLGAGITGKLFSAAWDPWRDFPDHAGDLARSDVYTLRRIVPADRGFEWEGIAR